MATPNRRRGTHRSVFYDLGNNNSSPVQQNLHNRHSSTTLLESTRPVDGSPTRLDTRAMEDSSELPSHAPGCHSSTDGREVCPFRCCELEPLGEYVLNQGFFNGLCSDITIKAFGEEYKLHRLLLCRSGYFKSFFMGPWAGSDETELSLVFDHDEYLTKEAFEIAISTLYGQQSRNLEKVNLLSMVAMGQYLDISDLVCYATAQLVDNLSFENIATLTHFATQNDYGQANERILANCKGFLCTKGYQAGVRAWDGIPCSFIASIVGMDSFFVPSEWERALFIVATVDERSTDLGLTISSDQPADDCTSWFVPTKDETIFGTPDEIHENMTHSHHIRDDLPSGKTTENAGDSMYRLTKIPPFRFSIAFTGVSELEAEKRVYAKTLWYAGSYWNLYIQKVRHRKGFQMGVYIHRATSCAPSRSGLLNKDTLNSSILDSESLGSISDGMNGLSINADNMDGVVSLSCEGGAGQNMSIHDDIPGDDDEDDLAAVEAEGDDTADASFLSYEDRRIKTSVYYIIYTPSRKINSSLTCFISTPDLFKKSQSWGWKSNSMCSFNEDGTLADGEDKVLKFMVVLDGVTLSNLVILLELISLAKLFLTGKLGCSAAVT
ncbi:Germ cell-less protein-like 1 [Cyberlindnera fabianii]|uniref:Germ cell-less protein-like 1 n=1 Tax=Cyberlindnera fabianii TaxID=36022 RepID=A0A1V2L3I7_CYBFA|nr:Germ cell-less protein-like 1 [Cyberlindnera fabianii]